jgi:hypothetical protein
MKFMRTLLLGALLAVALAMLGVGSSAALAAQPRVGWKLEAIAVPTSFQPGASSSYKVLLTNVGTRPSGGPITVTIALPEHVTTAGTPSTIGEFVITPWACSPEGEGQREVKCTTEGSVPALDAANAIFVPVNVEATAGAVLTNVSVSGGDLECGGAGPPVEPVCPTARASTATPVGAAKPPFDVLEESFSSGLLNAAGEPDTTAGDHPGAQSTGFLFPTSLELTQELHVIPYTSEEVKQIVVDLPPGVVGDPLAAPKCPLSVATSTRRVESVLVDECPSDTRVGTLSLIQPTSVEQELSIFNVVPEQGYAAEFAVFLPVVQRVAFLYATVGSASEGYPVQVTSAPQDGAIEDDGVSTTFYGDPLAIDGSSLAPMAFFTNPSDCQASGFTTTIHVDSWEHPGSFLADGAANLADPNWKSASFTAPPVTGCEALQFHPTFSLAPTSTQPNVPSGLNVNLQVPQNEEPHGLATPPLKDVSVTLPEGFDVSPSSATGLEACSDAQFDLSSSAPGSCPAGSEIGEVAVHTPLLEEVLKGQVFLGDPQCNPCSAADAQSGRMIRLFIQIHSERYGVTIKSPGVVSLDPATGRLVSTFKNLPQQPFSDLEFKFKEGPRAPLATPSGCGEYTTNTSLTPWSTPYTPAVAASSSFSISGCAGNPFAPAFGAGTTNNQAGAYSPLALSFSRTDSEQDFDALEAVLPSGLLAKLAGVQQCGEAELNAAKAQVGECPSSSQIGTVTVGSGPGPDPFYVTGRVYLTGAYNGGPFGEAVVVPAVAGPFNLGNVVVRGSIRVNRTTAQASVVSDPFPSILDGIPLQVKNVHVSIDRPEFTLNPTNCSSMAFGGTLVSTRGASAPVSSRFQAANCASLAFKPSFTASTAGKASKADGASLDVKVAYPAPFTSYANIKSVKVDLPKQLPSRLTTLQKACLAATFEANPAGCPAASDVGSATATTPLLASPVSGPAYLVSHGNEAFPDLEIVLQGEGITLVLDGNTDIKKGITSSTFKSIPDAPVSSFELKLPTGKYSILGANVREKAKYSLCGQTLNMPTAITGQNGAVIKQTTKISVTGCPKVKKAKAAKRAKQESKSNRRGK